MVHPWPRRLLLSCLVLFAVEPGFASAQDFPERRVGVSWHGGVPQLSFSARDLINAQVEGEIRGGLPQNIVTKIYAYESSGGEVRSATVLSCEVTFDLLSEQFRLRIADPISERTTWVRGFDDVVRQCLVMSNLPVGRASEFRSADTMRLFFAVEVEFNPMSQATVERIRRLIARGGGFDDQSVFGSFVSMFVNRNIGRADRTIRFRSQTMVTVP